MAATKLEEATTAAMRLISDGIARNPAGDFSSVAFAIPCRTLAQSVAINRYLVMGKVRVAHVAPGKVYLVAVRKEA
jgi:hypothetical protein